MISRISAGNATSNRALISDQRLKLTARRRCVFAIVRRSIPANAGARTAARLRTWRRIERRSTVTAANHDGNSKATHSVFKPACWTLCRDRRELLGQSVGVLSAPDNDGVQFSGPLKRFNRVSHRRAEELLTLSLAVRREPGVNAGFCFVVVCDVHEVNKLKALGNGGRRAQLLPPGGRGGTGLPALQQGFAKNRGP